MFYLSYLFVYFFSLLALRSHNRRMARGYVTVSWGYGVILISCD